MCQVKMLYSIFCHNFWINSKNVVCNVLKYDFKNDFKKKNNKKQHSYAMDIFKLHLKYMLENYPPARTELLNSTPFTKRQPTNHM